MTPVLVLLHPLGLDRECWPEIPNAIALDMPGHGNEPLPRNTELTIEGVADFIVGCVPGPLDVVGLSAGASVAMRVALRHPSHVRSLIVGCTSGDRPGKREQLLERGKAAERDGMAGVLDLTIARWFTEAALSDPAHPGVRYARERLLRDDPKSFAAWWRALAAHSLSGELTHIDRPVTLIAGIDDVSASVASVSDLFRQIPNSRMEVLKGPHMIQLESPGAFAAAVSRHLAWLENGATQQ